jgi:non-heme chloroperoxidase
MGRVPGDAALRSCAAYRDGARSNVAITNKQGRTIAMPHRSLSRRLAGPSVATLLLAAVSAPTMAQDKAFKQVWVKTPDGLTISAQDWGNPTGPEIVFSHGFSQSHLSWIKQVTGELAKDFHMVTYDLRGHGNSDKPLEPERYKDSKA